MNKTTNMITKKKLALLLALPSTTCIAQDKSGERMNIIYIMTDDHSFQTISAYGSKHNQTPNIDRIADNGVVFNRGYVTNSISGPSRAVLLTGKFSHMNGFRTNSDYFDGSQQTFPKILQQNGYQTAIIGKWHLSSDPTGFDYWNILPGQGIYYNPIFIEMGKHKRHEGYATTLTTDIALDWIENRRDEEKPFCLLLHHKAPHRTWMPDTTHLGMYDDVEFKIPSNFYDDYTDRKGAEHQKMSIHNDEMNLVYDLKINHPDVTTSAPHLDRAGRGMCNSMNANQKKKWDSYYADVINEYISMKPTKEELVEWKFQRYMKDYLSCIQSVDENIGRVLDYLEQNDMMDNTVIVYTSDQGFYMGEHGWFDKRFMYEESFRTPLLVHHPSCKRQRIDKAHLVQNLDFAPTILDIAGIQAPADMQGESLIPLIVEGEHPNWRKSIYYHFYENKDEHQVQKHYGVRDDRYKLIHFYTNMDQWEFYDLKKDPKEVKNQISNPKYSKEISRMKQELKRLQTKYKDDSKS